MTHRQALHGFPDTSRVSLHENNKINLTFLAVPTGSREVIVSFSLISERTVGAYASVLYHRSARSVQWTQNNSELR
jgi:hypothetical protein